MRRGKFLGSTRSRRKRSAMLIVTGLILVAVVVAFFFLPKAVALVRPLLFRPTPSPAPIATPAPSAIPAPEPDFVSAPVVSIAGESHPYYQMEVTIDENLKDVQVVQQIEYQNNTGQDLTEIVLRCFINSLSDLNAFPIADKDAFDIAGTPITLTHVLVNEQSTQYVFDGKYKTTLRLQLAQPLPADQSVKLMLTYRFGVVPAKYRLGRSNGSLQLSFFYPVPAQFEDGAWSVTNILKSGYPWYQSTANYDVVIDAPKDAMVAATGTTSDTQNVGDRQKLYVRAANARDFAIGISKGKRLSQSSTSTATIRTYVTSLEKGKLVASLTKAILEVYGEQYSAYVGDIELMQCVLKAKSATQSGVIFLDTAVVQGDSDTLEYELALALAQLYTGVEVGGANNFNALLSAYFAAAYFETKSPAEFDKALQKHEGAKALNQLKIDIGAIEFTNAIQTYLQKGKMAAGNVDDFTAAFTDSERVKQAIAPYL